MSGAASSMDNFEKRPAKLQFCELLAAVGKRRDFSFSLNAISSPEWVARPRQGWLVLLIINVPEDKSFFFCRV